jgi:hypothetical protein
MSSLFTRSICVFAVIFSLAAAAEAIQTKSCASTGGQAPCWMKSGDSCNGVPINAPALGCDGVGNVCCSPKSIVGPPPGSFNPVGPFSPVGPFTPTSPFGPVGPLSPGVPIGAAAPTAPSSPNN